MDNGKSGIAALVGVCIVGFGECSYGDGTIYVFHHAAAALAHGAHGSHLCVVATHHKAGTAAVAANLYFGVVECSIFHSAKCLVQSDKFSSK